MNEFDQPEVAPAPPVITEPTELEQFEEQLRQTAQVRAVTNIDGNPEKAARAFQLSQATGVPQGVVADDVDGFDQKVKSALASRIIEDNEYIQKYLVKNPLAAQLSANDYSNLDDSTRKFKEFQATTSAPNEFFRAIFPAILPTAAGIAVSIPVAGAVGTTTLGPWGGIAAGIGTAFVAGYAAAFGQEAVLDLLPEEWLKAVGQDKESRALGQQAHPWAAWLGQNIPAIAAGKIDPKQMILMERLLSGGINAALETAQQAVQDPEMHWGQVAASFAIGAAQPRFNRAGDFVANTGIRSYNAFSAKLAPYVNIGKAPPMGLDPVIDGFKNLENEAGLAKLEELLQTAIDTPTRDKSPKMYESLLNEVGDANIGVSVEAIKALYGENIPASDDGILGWIPDIVAKLEAANETGGDIRIPVAEWVANIDPAVFVKLRDFIRINPDGITRAEYLQTQEQLNRAKVIDEAQNKIREEQAALSEKIASYEQAPKPEVTTPESIQAAADYIGVKQRQEALAQEYEALVLEKEKLGIPYSDVPPIDEFDLVSEISGTQPLAAPLERSLQLQPNSKPITYTDKNTGDVRTAHSLNLVDDTGRVVGFAEITIQNNGKTAYVENISTMDVRPNSLGFRMTRDVLRQIKSYFPGIESVEGFRMSGAREKAGTEREVSVRAALEELQNVKDNLEFRRDYDHLIPKDATVGGDPIRLNKTGGTVQPIYQFPAKSGFDPSIIIHPNKDIQQFDAVVVNRLRDTVGDVPVTVLSQRDTDKAYRSLGGKVEGLIGGFYDYGTHSIFLSESVYQGQIGHPLSQTVLREEAFHAYTFKAIREDKTIREDIINIVKDFKEYYDDGTIKRHEYRLKDPYETAIAITGDEAFRAALQEAPMSERTKALINASDKAFRSIYGDSPTLWDGLKWVVSRILNKLLGFRPKDTLLDGLLSVMNRIDAHTEAYGFRPEGMANRPDIPASELPQTPTEVAMFEKANAMGFTADELKRFLGRIEEDKTKKIEKIQDRALTEAKKRESQLWKEEAGRIRPEVVKEINGRPDIAADNFIRNRQMFDQKLNISTRLRADTVPEEFRGMFPKEYFSKTGLAPDDIAPLFGYTDGVSMLAHLAELEGSRQASGLRPAEFKRQIITDEVNRRVSDKYGDPEANALLSAQDQVASETTIRFLHEELLALAQKAGIKSNLPIDFDTIYFQAKERFGELPLADQAPETYFAAALKAMRQAQTALLSGKTVEAFQQNQRRFISVMYANEALRLQAERSAFDGLAKTYSKEKVGRRDQTVTDYIQALLKGAGLPVRRTLDNITENIEASPFKTLPDLVNWLTNTGGFEVQVADWLTKTQVPIEKMTVREFYDLKDAIETMNHASMKLEQVYIAGEVADFKATVDEIASNIKTKPKLTAAEKQGMVDRLVRAMARYESLLARPEEIIKDLDLREDLGPLWRGVMEGLLDSKHTNMQYEEALVKKVRELKSVPGWMKTLTDELPNNFFRDAEGNLYPMLRKDLIGIMLNWGTVDNIRAFVSGHAKTPAEQKALYGSLDAWVKQHATKEDWNFVQEIWNLFKEWKDDGDALYRRMSGKAPERIKAKEIQTPHGKYDGGYFPIILDSAQTSLGDKGISAESLFGPLYSRATPNQSYLKSRVKHNHPIDFRNAIDLMAPKMKQQIHDISYRESVTQAFKILNNQKIKQAMKDHYGVEYQEKMIPWLRDIANQQNTDNGALRDAEKVLRWIRMRLVNHVIAGSLKLLISPMVATMNPAAMTKVLWAPKETVALAHAKSKEIPHSFQNMDRDYRELLSDLTYRNRLTEVEAAFVRAMFWPLAKVEQGFRIVTFNDFYKKGLADGLSEADAAAVADYHVRERHGATSIVDLPALFRGSEIWKLVTLFGGFFSTYHNWQRQIPQQYRNREISKMMTTVWGAILVPGLINALIFMDKKEDESYWKVLAKGLAAQPFLSMVGAREIATYFTEGHTPRTPLSAMYQAFDGTIRLAAKAWKGEETNREVRVIMNLIGLGRGVPLNQIGLSGQYIYDVQQGRIKPNSIADWMSGIIWGPPKR